MEEHTNWMHAQLTTYIGDWEMDIILREKQNVSSIHLHKRSACALHVNQWLRVTKKDVHSSVWSFVCMAIFPPYTDITTYFKYTDGLPDTYIIDVINTLLPNIIIVFSIFDWFESKSNVPGDIISWALEMTLNRFSVFICMNFRDDLLIRIMRCNCVATDNRLILLLS